MTNLYALLGISETASEESIRKAYRKLAKQYHPDVNNSSDAQAKFILINKAYEVLIDRQRRLAYDQKAGVRSDPYYSYNRKREEQRAYDEAESIRKKIEFEKRKETIRNSKLFYPYMLLLYFCTTVLIFFSVMILIGCAFTIIKYHVLMFLFMMPFISLSAWLFKSTLDEYKKYRLFFFDDKKAN